jgi:hypothetical protein
MNTDLTAIWKTTATITAATTTIWQWCNLRRNWPLVMKLQQVTTSDLTLQNLLKVCLFVEAFILLVQ